MSQHNIFGFELYYLFYNFFIYSFFGWIYETCFVSIRNKAFINRGFLNGPIIPIYGAGATIVYMVFSQYRTDYIIVFLGGIGLATVLEYITSYVMEQLFHAKWWDYSSCKFNIKGRICLKASVFWGFLSVFMFGVLQPMVDYMILGIPKLIGYYVSIIVLLIFMTDLTFTVIGTVKLDKTLENMQQFRLELSEYIAGTKLYETKEDIKIRLENYKISEIFDNIKKKLDYESKLSEINIGKEGLELKRRTEEIELRLKEFLHRYQNNTGKTQKIQTRLIKAFPNLRYNNRESALKDLKDKLHKKKDL